MKLYTSMEKAPKDIYWILRIDSYFKSHYKEFRFTKKDYEYLEQIDNAHICKGNKEFFENLETGVFHYTQLSTGLKALLIIRHIQRAGLKNRGVDVTECGPNVLEYIFDLVKDGSIPIILRHKDILGLSDRVVIVNDNIVVRKMIHLYPLLDV